MKFMGMKSGGGGMKFVGMKSGWMKFVGMKFEWDEIRRGDDKRNDTM